MRVCPNTRKERLLKNAIRCLIWNGCATPARTFWLRPFAASGRTPSWPGGPAVDNGFYYDVELDHRISTEDFERIEEEMKKVVKENQPFQKEVISRAEAMKMAESGELGALGPRNTPSQFKIDLLNDIPEDEEISLFRNGDFTDLCAGPHVGRTGQLQGVQNHERGERLLQGRQEPSHAPAHLRHLLPEPHPA